MRFFQRFRFEWIKRNISSLPKLHLFERALDQPTKVALSSRNESHTFGQLIQDSIYLAKEMQSSKKLSKGDRIGILMPRDYSFVVSLFAVWALECVAVPIYPDHPTSSIEYTLTDAEAELLIQHESLTLKTKHMNSKISTMNVSNVIHQHGNLSQTSIGSHAIQKEKSGALLLYTSGTTGRPKGVFQTHENVEAQILSLIESWEISNNDKILHVLPLHHTHGFINSLICPLTAGATVEFLDPFDANKVWERWMDKRKDLTLFMAVPTIYAKLINSYNRLTHDLQIKAKQSCGQFRLMVSGSSALPVSVFQEWKEISGHTLLERYGMTEIGMALGNPLHGQRIPATVGYPFPKVDVRLVDEFGKEIKKEEQQGILEIHGPQVFSEYWKRPDATTESFSYEKGQRWFKTGDVAIRSKDGRYRILGRSSVDIIKSGGYKISALEIERELLEMSKIKDVAVLGIPSKEWGESIGAVIVGDSISLEEIKIWLKPRLPKYKIPHLIHILPDMPRNALGKINKKELLKLFTKTL